MRRYFNILAAMVLAVVTFSSCGISKLEDQIKIGEITRIELKGLTGLVVGVDMTNDSRGDISLSEGVAVIYAQGEQLVKLVQVGAAVSPAGSSGEVTAVWRMEDISPLKMLQYTPKVMQRNFEGLSISYEARLATRGMGRKISGENVDITNLISIFAK